MKTRNFTRITAALLSFLMLCSVLACGKADTGEEATTTTALTTTAATASETTAEPQGDDLTPSITDDLPADLKFNNEVVTFLYRASENTEAVNAENPFSDVSPNEWYSTAVIWAADREITIGMGDGLFGVENICNRAQIVTFLYRAMN